MLKIRLRRMGSRHKPFYRVVVSDSRQTPLAAAIEEIGYYDPRQDPAVIAIDSERVDHWTSVGAQLSGAVRKLVKQAKARPAAAETAAEAPAETPVKAKAAKAETAKAETAKAETAKAETVTEAPPEAVAAEEPAAEETAAAAEEEKAAPDAAEATPA